MIIAPTPGAIKLGSACTEGCAKMAIQNVNTVLNIKRAWQCGTSNRGCASLAQSVDHCRGDTCSRPHTPGQTLRRSRRGERLGAHRIPRSREPDQKGPSWSEDGNRYACPKRIPPQQHQWHSGTRLQTISGGGLKNTQQDCRQGPAAILDVDRKPIPPQRCIYPAQSER